MKRQKLVGGPTGQTVLIALAKMILSGGSEPVKLTFYVNEGTDKKPNEVKREITVIGVQFPNGGGDSAMELLLPTFGPGAPERPTRVYFYPTAPQGHVGHLEIYPRKAERKKK